MPIKSVAVFCGSRTGNNPAFHAAATELGKALAHAGLKLIYGGGSEGMMGLVADAHVAAGGQATGVIPQFLADREVAHEGLTELVVVTSMHVRKQCMVELAEAFIALPGGVGTLDELVEIITWRQLGLHAKPIFVCDIGNWSRGIIAAFNATVDDGFTDEAVLNYYELVPDVPALIARLTAPPPA